ncbi:MAG: class I SAM-dependent methyltransferase [Chthoniobacterales bacterium]
MQNPRLILSGWLRKSAQAEEKSRILEIANQTGLKEEAGNYFGANFERALLLRHIVRTLRPRRILELGTGRGLGSLVIADVLEKENIEAQITSVDIIPPTTSQRWPICVDGKYSTPHLALDTVWNTHFPELRKRILLKTGPTTAVLPQLAAEGKRYDFIFIDAGHDVHSVFHDFAYSTAMLEAEGSVLMDDFSPLEAFGLGTCIVAAHAPRYYNFVEVLETEGVVFEPLAKDMTRGMVFLSGKKPGEYVVSPLLMQLVRVVGKLLEAAFRPGLFPLKKKS